jgi:hypothetical protein
MLTTLAANPPACLSLSQEEPDDDDDDDVEEIEPPKKKGRTAVLRYDGSPNLRDSRFVSLSDELTCNFSQPTGKSNEEGTG